MGMYRCQAPQCADRLGRLLFDFESEVPVCPQCGTNGRIPRFANIIIKLETLHFEPMSHIEGIGIGEVACTPGKPRPDLWRATGMASVANCKACKATQVWQDAAEKSGLVTVHAETDFVMEEPKQREP